MIVRMSNKLKSKSTKSVQRSRPSRRATRPDPIKLEVGGVGFTFPVAKSVTELPVESTYRQRRQRIELELTVPTTKYEGGSELHASGHSAISHAVSGNRYDLAAALRQLADHVANTHGAPIVAAHIAIVLQEAPIEVIEPPARDDQGSVGSA